MKFHLFKSLLVVSCVLVAGLVTGQSQSKLKAHKITVDGTSTLHDWTSEATKVEWKGIVTVEGNKVTELKDVTITIPVKSIKSTKGKTMDNKTYEAFNAQKHPDIVYKLMKFNGVGTLKATGLLEMAGTTQTVMMDVTSKVLANGDVQFTGKQALKMPDYKMDPPTAMMGTIKVGPEVTVNFDLTVTP